jgi:archaeal flagellar protein FlaJ
MELKKSHWIGLSLALSLIILSFFLFKTKLFFPMIGVGILIGILPFVISVINKTRINNEKEEMFLEFARNLVESVKTGTPISKSIINVGKKSYGVLSENINKLASQISLGIPLNLALRTFAEDVDNKSISRSLILIGQAERSGGDIGRILESVAEAVNVSDKLKKERKATISTLVVQGYIIFFIFMIIVLIMQFKILPMVSGISMLDANIGGFAGGEAISQQELSNSFLYLILVQGFFSGLAIGKLSEGNIKAGAKHSFTLTVVTFLVSIGANLFWGA